MDFSFSSILNMSISGSILIGVLFIVLKNNKILARFGVALALICSLLIMLRLYLPFEFPFTTSIYIKNAWPVVYLFFINERFKLGALRISLCDLLFCIWAAGSCFLFIRSYVNYRRIKQTITGYCNLEEASIHNIVGRLNPEFHRKKQFRLVKTDEVMTPMIFGIRTPYIILPELSLSEEEWEYILKHEMTHYYHGHLYYKLLCEILCDMYWWNPFVYLLKKFINNLLEMNVDADVTRSLKDIEKIEYLDCLLKVTKLNAMSQVTMQWAVTFSRRDSPLISQRIHMVCDSMAGHRKSSVLPSIAMTAVFTILMGCSLLFTIEPDTYCDSPVNAGSTFSFNESDCYLIENADGTYDVYVESQYMTTVDFPIEDDPSIIIYSK